MSDVYDDGAYRKDLPSHKRTNPLLVRPVVGQVRPTTYALPNSNFTYGRRDQVDQEGAREVVGSWLEHSPNPASAPGRDFMRLNKGAVSHGAVNSKEMATFRQTHDARLNTGPVSTFGRAAQLDPHFTYGKPCKPSTPIHDVVTNSYQRQAIEEARTQRERKAVRTIQNQHGKYAQSQHTRASLGHTKTTAPPQAAPFKMSRFQDVEARTNTFRGTGRASLNGKTTANNINTGNTEDKTQNIYTHEQEHDHISAQDNNGAYNPTHEPAPVAGQ